MTFKKQYYNADDYHKLTEKLAEMALPLLWGMDHIDFFEEHVGDFVALMTAVCTAHVTFSEIFKLAETGDLFPPDIENILKECRDHIHKSTAFKSVHARMLEMKTAMSAAGEEIEAAQWPEEISETEQ